MSQFGYEGGGGDGEGPRPDGLLTYDPTHPDEDHQLGALLAEIEIPGHGRLVGTVRCLYSTFTASPTHFVLVAIEIIEKHPVLSTSASWVAKMVADAVKKRVMEWWATRQQNDLKAMAREAPEVRILDPYTMRPVTQPFRLPRKTPSFLERCRRWLGVTNR